MVLSGRRASATTGGSRKQEAVPEKVWVDLLQISAVVRGQRPIDRVTTGNTTIALCSQFPLSLTELSALLGRRRSYLQQRVLPELLASGYVHFVYPAHPNHPRQRYVAGSLADKSDSLQQTSIQ